MKSKPAVQISGAHLAVVCCLCLSPLRSEADRIPRAAVPKILPPGTPASPELLPDAAHPHYRPRTAKEFLEHRRGFLRSAVTNLEKQRGQKSAEFHPDSAELKGVTRQLMYARQELSMLLPKASSATGSEIIRAITKKINWFKSDGISKNKGDINHWRDRRSYYNEQFSALD